MGANDEMDVVRHETPGEQSHRSLCSSTLKEDREPVEIGIVMEDGLSGVASGQDVIADVGP
jgi:hypothetical protein